MNIQNLIEIYNELPYPEQRQALSGIRTQEELEELLKAAKTGSRTALRVLADLGKRAAKFVQAYRDDFLALLKSDDPKKRGTTARLMGDTDPAGFLDALIEASDNEETMYVLPEYLGPIGKAKNEKARKYLEGYKIRSQVDKHVAEEKEALRKALANFVKRETANVRILSSDIIACSTPNLEITLRALRDAGLDARKFGRYAAVSGLTRFSDIYKVRAYDTAYIYLGSTTVDALPQFLEAREEAIAQRTQVRGYRLEVDCETHQERTRIIGNCVDALKKLQNTPTSYSIQILVDVDEKENRARVFLDPMTDTRFAYRERAVPASMGCATAACLCAFASSYFNADARVLDDFCGAGTLLFERGYYPFHSLTGVDINPMAIEAANENSTHARVHPQFHHADALRFTAKRYNEVMCNLPFGMRVGNHEKNQKLYREYFDILPRITTQGALIVLFTHEKKLTQKLIEKAEHLVPVASATFNAGGLYPTAYLLKRDESSYAIERNDLR